MFKQTNNSLFLFVTNFVIIFILDESSKENEPNHFTKAFNKENLSDCGISEEMLQHFCSSDPNVVKPLDCVKYNTEDDTYMWWYFVFYLLFTVCLLYSYCDHELNHIFVCMSFFFYS